MKKLRFLWNLTYQLPADARLQRLHCLLSYMRPKSDFNANVRIAIECVEDPFYLTLFTYLAHALRKRASIKVELFVCQSLHVKGSRNWKKLIYNSFPLNRLRVNQWIRLWDVVTSQIAYRSTSLDYPLGDLIDVWQSWRIWRQLCLSDDLEKVSIQGILCGDLVIDSYLRFRPSPRVIISDWFLLYVLWQAHRDVRRAQFYFRSAQPILYLTTYTTYIQHGIAVRVALQEGVRVFSFGSFQEFGKVLSQDYFYHTRNPLNYQRDFNLLPNAAFLIKEASRQLEARLLGAIDSATSYMASSAYRVTTKEVPDVSNAVIVFLHDFYDSPHVYADLIFSDFWEWICFTVETLQSAGIHFLVKPHPNQIELSDAVIDELLERFPDLELIPPQVTNRQLVDAGMACAVTVYGTIAHEMAYMGVPTISCARHPHIAFDFCKTANNRSNYAKLLCEALTTVNDRELFRDQALRFYVMHNLSLPPDQLDLRDAFIVSWKAFNDPLIDVSEQVGYFEKLLQLPGFETFIDELIRAE